MVLLGARDVQQNGAEGLDGVHVTPHHQVREAQIVVERDLTGGDARKHALLAQIDGLERLERQPVVAQQAVHAQQTHDAEVAHHAVHGVRADVVLTACACTSPSDQA